MLAPLVFQEKGCGGVDKHATQGVCKPEVKLRYSLADRNWNWYIYVSLDIEPFTVKLAIENSFLTLACDAFRLSSCHRNVSVLYFDLPSLCYVSDRLETRPKVFRCDRWLKL